MIDLDQTPKDGDFARYVDKLLSRSSSMAAATDATRPRSATGMTSSNEAAKRSVEKRHSRGLFTSTRAIEPSRRATSPDAMQPPNGVIAALAPVALVLGIALVIAGFAAATFNLVFVLAGASLVAWAFRRIAARWPRRDR